MRPALPPRHLAASPVLLALLLGACATAPPQDSGAPARSLERSERMLAAIHAAAGADDRELAVQPLRDAGVEDLRQRAQRLQAQRRHAEAAHALDEAIAIVADDPALLQERAELALLLGDDDDAQALAQRGFALGAKVGPLCRRHWALIRQLRQARAEADAAAMAAAAGGKPPPAAPAQTAAAQAALRASVATADAQLAACKVAGPDRY